MTIYVFGYGSLIDNKKKLYPVKVAGLKRAINVNCGNGTYKVLGVKKNQRHWCNGVLFKVNETDLAKLIKREQKYTPELLDPAQLTFAYTKTHPTFKPDDQIIYFLPQPAQRLSQKEAASREIRPDYLNQCLRGAAAISEDFLKDFLATTQR
jgi:hypothetical protein